VALIIKNGFIFQKSIFQNILLVFVPFFISFLSCYFLGFISKNVELNINTYGVESFNLNSFFNSYGTSLFIKPLSSVSSAQIEGYSYLGLGIIFLIILSIFM